MLERLERARRPMAWLVLLVGLGGLLATFPFGLTTQADEPEFWVTLAGFLLLSLDGYDKLMALADSEQLDELEEGQR